MTRNELIRALEAADGPDRELDAAIDDLLAAQKLGWTVDRARDARQRAGTREIPQFTASLDAKLPGEDEGCWEISGPRRYLHIPWRAMFMPWNDGGEHVGWGATEAIARRIAALRAQEASS